MRLAQHAVCGLGPKHHKWNSGVCHGSSEPWVWIVNDIHIKPIAILCFKVGYTRKSLLSLTIN